MARRAQEKEALEGLASKWEACQLTRRRLLLDSFLLKWPRPELTGVPSYQSASLNFNTLEPLFRMWAASMTSPKTPKVKKVWELVGQKSTKGEVQCDDGAADALEQDDEDYEPESPNDDLGEDVVPFINGRLDEQDEAELEVSGAPDGSSSAVNEDSSAKQLTAEVVHAGNAGAAESEDANAKQTVAEVAHAGSAGAAENEDSNAKQPIAEVSGHAENQDSSAKQPAEVSGLIAGNSAVLTSMAEASAQPELIVCSDDEEVPRPRRPIPTPVRAGLPVSREERLQSLKRKLLELKQKKENVNKTSFRRGGPPHDDPSRVETQAFDIDAAAQSWEEVPNQVDPEPVDLQAVAAAGEVLTKEKQDAMLTETKAKEDEKPGHGRGGTKGAKENGSTAEVTEAQLPEAKQTRTKAAKKQNSEARKEQAVEADVSTEAQPAKARRTNAAAKAPAKKAAAQDNAPEAAVAETEAQPAKRRKVAKESVPEAELTQSKGQQQASGSQPKKSRKNDAQDSNAGIRGTVAAKDGNGSGVDKKAARKAIRDGLDMPVYCFVDIDLFKSQCNGSVLYLCYKDVPEHTAMITIWKFIRRADLVEKAKANMTPALEAKLAGIKDQFANRAEV
ncbi:unnamed protein product [Symbiodinium sp. CCMP2456]|nr:unnamed protein product [Symbiodinium sp. CCMP2456]